MGPWGVAAATVPAIAGFFGQERANRTNIQQARENRSFQANQAQRQMAFQERMRNTQWQSAIADMEAAGINPALAYSQGPNAAPGGAAGGGAQATVGDSVSSAMQMAMQAHQLRKLNAEATQAQYEEMRLGHKTAIELGEGGKVESFMARMLRAQLQLTANQGRLAGAQADKQTPLGDLYKALGDNILPIIMPLLNAAGGAANRLIPGGN